MKINLKYLFILSSVVLFCSLNIHGAIAQTQTEMNEQAYQAAKKADNELNNVYKKILIKHKKDKVFISKLEKAQIAWIKFKDAEIDAIYPEEDKLHNYGSVYPMCIYCDLTEITKQRIKELKLWLKGIEEGVFGKIKV